ncbi:MAG: hypothetical protein WKG07_00840 [Hymenobacter sp.]
MPVGLILSAVGGTRVEAWMSTPSLRAFPEVKVPASLDTVKSTPIRRPRPCLTAW